MLRGPLAGPGLPLGKGVTTDVEGLRVGLGPARKASTPKVLAEAERNDDKGYGICRPHPEELATNTLEQ